MCRSDVYPYCFYLFASWQLPPLRVNVHCRKHVKTWSGLINSGLGHSSVVLFCRVLTCLLASCCGMDSTIDVVLSMKILARRCSALSFPLDLSANIFDLRLCSIPFQVDADCHRLRLLFDKSTSSPPSASA